MCTVIKCLCALSLLNIVTCVKVITILDDSHVDTDGKPLLLKRGDNHSGGIFTTFLKNLLRLLSEKFPTKKLVKYCRALAGELGQLEYRYARKLAKHVRKISRMYREELKGEISEYRKRLDKSLPAQENFLQAMNEVFTLQQAVLFNDYIYDVRDYGNEDKLLIDKETKSILKTIVEAIERMSAKEQNDLMKKLKRAISEYRKEGFKDFDFDLKLAYTVGDLGLHYNVTKARIIF